MTITLDSLVAWQNAMIPYLAGLDEPSTLDKLKAWQADMIPYLASLDAPIAPTTRLPRHRFGVHLIGSREGDLKYIEQLKPPAVKIVDPDPNVVKRVLAAIDPNGVVILRDHPLSEQKSDMAADPVGTGRRHAANWIVKLTTGRFKEFGGDKRIVVVGINEPNVHNQAEEQIVYLYTKAFLEGLTSAGIRGLALNLSVGWPRNDGDGRPPVWDTFTPLEGIINRGNHFLCVHEYWYPNVQDKWGWYGNRIAKCPMSVPVIIGECGYTRQLANLPQPWGWIGNMPAPTYADQLMYYHDNVDPSVFAILPFTSGYASADWAAKDILPAAADVLARVHAYAWPTVWPVNKNQPTNPPVTPPVVVPPVIVPPVDPEEPDEVKTIIFPAFTNKITGYYGSVYKNSVGAAYAHEGLDISKAVGVPIYAPADGIVAYSDVDPLYGNYIRTYHPALKLCFFYAHLSERKVQNGNSIKAGQLIGLTGNTGNSSGPHLHFAVREMDENGHYMTDRSVQSNATLDPLAWLAGWLSAGNKVEER